MKLYGTLETGRGKVVSISDNDSITATLYDGNMKAYSITIDWCNVGDTDHWKCPQCGHFENWSDYENGTPVCPTCDIDMKHKKPTMGAIVTTREWRNREKTNDRQKAQRE